MSSYENLLANATSLPVEERLQLIDALWDSLPGDSLPPLSPEWVVEIRRRSAEFDSGGVKTVPWQQIKLEALKRIGVGDSNAHD